MLATNPPWGRKVTLESVTARFYARLGAEVARVLAPGGRAVVLTHAPRLVRAWPLQVVRRMEISVYGQTPVVMVLESIPGGEAVGLRAWLERGREEDG